MAHNSVLYDSVMTENTLSQLDCSVLSSSPSLEGINQYLTFLHGDSHSHQGKVGFEATNFDCG